MWRYVKIPKAIALLAFLLPWMTVSCSKTPVAEANGWELVIGHIHQVIASAPGQVQRQQPTHLNYYFAGAVALIVIGLILSLLRRRFAGVVVGTSLLALALIWAGANQYTSQRLAEAASKDDQSGMGAAAVAAMIRVDWQFGYWIALIALGMAAALAFLAIRDPDGPRI